jgi:hypothetical protein
MICSWSTIEWLVPQGDNAACHGECCHPEEPDHLTIKQMEMENESGLVVRRLEG